jgi:hypothetical protein
MRLAYLTMSNVFGVLRLLPVGDRNKDTEILSLRHQLGVLQRSCVYFHVGEDAWPTAATLPATQQELRWYPSAGGTLSRTPPEVASSIALTIDPRAGHEPDREQPPAEREFVARPDTPEL